MKTKAFTLIEIMIIAVIVGLLVAMAIPAISHVRNRARAEKSTDPEFKLFVAWQKMTGNDLVTFDEFKRLRDAGMLQPMLPTAPNVERSR